MRCVSSVLLALSMHATALRAEEIATKSRVDEIFKEYDRSDSPGCVLGVFHDGKIEYARGYGMANLELSVALTAQSVLDLGSTAKQFAAFSIHLLARDGKLSLDDDIRKWLPEIPSYGKPIAIRHLLHHTGGLRDYLELFEFAGVRDEDLTTADDALAMLARQKAPNFAPGEEHVYSNSGYFLLSVVVRRASGKSLRDFAAERIFGPLGMRHTQFNDSHKRIIPNRATGYSHDEKTGAFGIEMSDWEQTGDGAVLTSVEDLYRWDRNFYDPKVGDTKLLEAMQTVGVLNSGRKLEYASALYLSSYRGLLTVSHGGSWAGYRAQLLRFPQQRFSVVCLCNLRDANPSRLAQRVAEVYLGDRMQPAEAAVEAKKPEKGAWPRMRVPSTQEDGEIENETVEPVERWEPAAAELQGLAGTYASAELDTTWRLVEEGGKLFIRHRGMPAEPLRPTIRDAMTLDGVQLSFRRGPGRRVTGFVLDAGRVRGVVFTRVPA